MAATFLPITLRACSLETQGTKNLRMYNLLVCDSLSLVMTVKNVQDKYL